jgi:hypothetical protein
VYQFQASDLPVCVVVSAAVGYLNALRLGRRGFELVVIDVGDSRDDGIEAVADSNIVILKGFFLGLRNRIVVVKRKTVGLEDEPTYVRLGETPLYTLEVRCTGTAVSSITSYRTAIT